ncbi:paramyosin, putative, partial [Pediculus humanus corporis]
MKPTYALEDLIFETEARGAENGTNEEMDIYAQLQQKEKDLILAAELGKALLEKNKELEKQIKEVTEESSKTIESLEQERHNIRRRLERVTEECDSKVSELQGDVSELKKTLDFREGLFKQMEKDKSQLIEELTAQNQRLKDQLKERGKTEENLTSQLSSLRDQCLLKKSSLQDHVSSLEILRDEVQILTDKKRDLENRLGQACEERDTLSAALEEAVERVRVLERHTRDQDSQIRSTARELERVRAANTTLGEQLDAMHSLDSPKQQSLLNEMECDDGFHSSAYSSLEKEIIACCETLRNICNYLKNRNSVGSEPFSDQSMLSDLNVSNVKVGILTSIVEELESLINLNDGRNSGLDSEVETKMEIDFHRTREALERAE